MSVSSWFMSFGLINPSRESNHTTQCHFAWGLDRILNITFGERHGTRTMAHAYSMTSNCFQLKIGLHLRGPAFAMNHHQYFHSFLDNGPLTPIVVVPNDYFTCAIRNPAECIAGILAQRIGNQASFRSFDATLSTPLAHIKSFAL